MVGRIYRLRKKSRVNYFSPADYEAAGKLIELVQQYDGLVNTVEVKTSNPTELEPIISAILEHNGFSVKKVITEKSKLKFSIPGTVANRSNAKKLVVNMKNDSIDTVDFVNHSYPVGTSVKGNKVPLKGYTQSQAESGDKGETKINTNTSSEGDSSSEASEKTSPNWLLIGGLSVVGLIAVLAIVKIIRK